MSEQEIQKDLESMSSKNLKKLSEFYGLEFKRKTNDQLRQALFEKIKTMGIPMSQVSNINYYSMTEKQLMDAAERRGIKQKPGKKLNLNELRDLLSASACDTQNDCDEGERCDEDYKTCVSQTKRRASPPAEPLQKQIKQEPMPSEEVIVIDESESEPEQILIDESPSASPPAVVLQPSPPPALVLQPTSPPAVVLQPSPKRSKKLPPKHISSPPRSKKSRTPSPEPLPDEFIQEYLFEEISELSIPSAPILTYKEYIQIALGLA